MRPIFIFSLPRSGSTLLQRILASHEAISTTSEPWAALPLFYSRRKQDVFAEYGHGMLADAMDDFVRELPSGDEVFHAAVREYLGRLYRAASGPHAVYFLDKTPRYHLICDDLVSCFPDGKFIVLWRNPLAVAASMMTTWAAGRWNLYRFKVDLFSGVDQLSALVERYRKRLCIIRYEDLVARPEEELQRVFRYLEIKPDLTVLDRFYDLKLNGRMGDPTGTGRFQTVTSGPTEKWRTCYQNPLRKIWARRYIKWLGQRRLETMGYNSRTLESEVKSLPNGTATFASDVLLMSWGFAYCVAEPYFIYQKLRTLRRWPQVVPHI